MGNQNRSHSCGVNRKRNCYYVAYGLDPFSVFGTMIYGAVGTERKNVTLLFKELAVLAFSSAGADTGIQDEILEPGGEGQILMGAWATVSA